MSDFEAMMEAYAQAGGDAAALTLPAAASMVVGANKVLAARAVPGVEFVSEELPHGVKAQIRVLPRTRLALPIHLCFGVLPAQFDAARDPIDVFRVDQRYWRSFWYEPQGKSRWPYLD